MPPPQNTKVRRKFRPKFSLRVAMFLFIVVALGCWWVKRSETQRHYCSKISTYEEDLVSWFFSETPSAWISWLPESIWKFRGGHYFRSIEGVRVNSAWAADKNEERESWSAVLPLLPNCRQITFSETELQEYHLDGLAKARSLEELSFRGYTTIENYELRFPEFLKLKTLTIGKYWGYQSNRHYNQFLAKCFDKIAASRDLRSVEALNGAHLIADQITENLKLETCRLHSNLVSDETIEKLSQLPLKEFSTHSPLSDKAALKLSKIESLEVVNLFGSKITDQGVRSIASLPNLREVRLPGCLASPAIGDLLSSARKLEVIDIDKVFIEDQSVTKLFNLPKLRSIKVMPGCLSAKTLATLPDCGQFFGESVSWDTDADEVEGEEARKRFGEVYKSSNPELTAFINFSAALPRDLKRQLRSLDIQGDEPQLKKAEKLDLSGSDIDDDDLATLAKFTSLKHLDLNATEITDAGIGKVLQTLASDGIKELWPRLRDLNLRATHINQSWIDFAGKLPDLKHLDLHASDVTDEGLINLGPGSFPKISSIRLSKTGISNIGLRNLSHFPALRFLDIDDTSVDDAAVKYLLACNKLRTLFTSSTSITHLGEQKLGKAIGSFFNGAKGDFEYHITEPSDVKSVLLHSGTLNNFKNIVIDGPNLTFAQLKPLLKVKRLRALRFKQCDLDVDEFVTLIQDRNYLNVELCGRFCDPAWLASIADKPEATCYSLHLRHENLGIEHLHAIKNWKQLERLYLSGGKWDRKTFEQCLQLPVLKSLKCLKFIDTEIELDAILGMKGHPTLVDVETPNFELSTSACDWMFREMIGADRTPYFGVSAPKFSEIFQSLPCDARTKTLHFNAKKCTAEDWSNLKRLQFIDALTISETNIDDAALDCLSQLPFLNDLTLTKVNINETGLRRLNEIPNLKSLKFTEIDFSDLDWREALSHCRISSIHFERCGVSGVSHVGYRSSKRFSTLEPIHCRSTGHRIRVSSRQP